MTITPNLLFRAAAAAAVAAGLLFAGVQLGHPHLDAGTVATTDVLARDGLKVLLTALAVVGITGIYLRQAERAGLLGLVGYLVLSTGYLLIGSTTASAVYVLPRIAASEPRYVDDVLTAATGGSPAGDVGLLGTVIQLQGAAYLAGGVLLGIALFRARVTARWASVLLAVGGLTSVALSQLPDPFFRLLAFPNAIALVGLGWSLWRSVRGPAATAAVGHPAVVSGAVAGQPGPG